MAFETLPANLRRIREEVAEIQAREGLSGAVRIVGVTKGHSRMAVEAAVAAGLEDVGENRVQEAVAKMDGPPLPVRWHMIGHVQTNKAKHLPGRFAMVHSVDSLRLVDALEKSLRNAETTLPMLVEVNVAREPQKTGCVPEAAEKILERAAGVRGLSPVGLMTMAPWTADETVQRRTFAALRALRDRYATPGMPLPELSMGMSSDYHAAVAEGATMVRLGTVLFGERPV